ncbi:MAG: hypothetical protein HOP28_00120 [Gemmatimonadales bacterium]|nr:hypothetical protein [Gemmatimonadales bacterium]
MPIAAPILRLFYPEAPPTALVELRAAFPTLTSTPIGLDFPLGEYAPEEILSLCLRLGVTARATRILTRLPSG